MTDREKEEIKLRLLFVIDIFLLLGIVMILFRIVESNNQMTIWLLEHGRLK